MNELNELLDDTEFVAELPAVVDEAVAVVELQPCFSQSPGQLKFGFTVPEDRKWCRSQQSPRRS
jgi:hypothetical protein